MNVALLSNSPRLRPLVGVIMVAALAACGGGGAATDAPLAPSVPTTQNEFAALVLQPATVSVPVGGTVQLAASARDANGNAIPGLPAPSFASSDVTRATVDGSGIVSGIAPGPVTITASLTAAGVTRSATAQITVGGGGASGGATVATTGASFVPPLLTIAPGESVTWQFAGATHNVTFFAATPAGGNIPDTPPGSSVSRTFPTAGTFDYECTRHANMIGKVVVQGASAPNAAFTSLSLAPATASLQVGATAQLAATPLDQSGAPMAGLPAASFFSSSTGIATITSAGLVTGVSAGSATITATLASGGVTRTATATVAVGTPAGGAIVTTQGLTFSPETIQIAPGGTVTWQFVGDAHDVTFEDDAPPGGNIPLTPAGGSASRTFPLAGDYDYECSIHKGMKGRVRVR